MNNCRSQSGKRYFSVKDAIELASNLGITLTRPTVISWAKKFDLGYPIGGGAQGRIGRWVIDSQKFRKFVQGEFRIEKKSSAKKENDRTNQ